MTNILITTIISQEVSVTLREKTLVAKFQFQSHINKYSTVCVQENYFLPTAIQAATQKDAVGSFFSILPQRTGRLPYVVIRSNGIKFQYNVSACVPKTNHYIFEIVSINCCSQLQYITPSRFSNAN
jgi:hypothetical protein